MEDRSWLILATVLAFTNAGWGAYALGAGTTRPNRWSDLLLTAGFLAQSIFLYLRGQQIGHCPISNLFEVIAFLTWSLLLTYLVIGSTYRWSILGFFTAPFVAFLNFFALVMPIDQANRLPPLGWLLELHASVSILAYGALGLTAIASLLYLIQERQLKQHTLGSWFFRLPAMGDLAVVQRRVLSWGFILLTIGLAAGVVKSHESTQDWVKFIWSGLVWGFYAGLFLTPRFAPVSQHRLAWLALMGYLFILLTFWGINSLSHLHRFEL